MAAIENFTGGFMMKVSTKKDMLFCVGVLAIMAAAPLISFGSAKQPPKSEPAMAVTEGQSSNISEKPSKDNKVESTKGPSSESDKNNENSKAQKSQKIVENSGAFKILDKSTGEVIEVSDRDFCIGAVAAEMTPDSEKEALKAQCVAAFTCYSKKRDEQRADPDDSLNGADFSADLENKEIYISKERMKKDSGGLFEDSYNKIAEAVDEVFGEVITYDGELIVCTYFAISSGATEACADVFGGDVSYLVPVASPYDTSAPGYLSKKKISVKEFKRVIKDEFPKAKLGDNVKDWVGKAERTASGMVKKIEIGGVEISGTEIRSAFGLRSADFDIDIKDDTVTFTVRGYGHGVGMSQYGANCMAQQGADYKEILQHYYPDTSISEI